MLPSPASEPYLWDYFDVTDDPRARAESKAVPELEEDLVDEGFRWVGCILGVLRRDGQKLVNEVWVHLDGETTAGVSGHHVELGTLFEDGSVIKTATRPSLRHWIVTHAGLVHHPKNRYDFASTAARLPRLLETHRDRVRRASATPVRGDPMIVHHAIRKRATELRAARMPTQHNIVPIVAAALSVIAGLVAMKARGSHAGVHGQPGFFLLNVGLGVLGTLIAFLPLVYAVHWWIAPWLVSLVFFGPPPSPASSMLEAAKHLPKRKWGDE
jgi:hypothetical protein